MGGHGGREHEEPDAEPEVGAHSLTSGTLARAQVRSQRPRANLTVQVTRWSSRHRPLVPQCPHYDRVPPKRVGGT